ncbi:hypothetical protein [Amycolatopsis sp. CA-126428]|uniref:hypothetical protein n=1 Tax=Amycolatopsis sp. CA-126428 TaxID=2073158 RepID=UPI0011B0DE1F|nr:hypothetical protein [Amycolatopsis sp. CA-126428]
MGITKSGRNPIRPVAALRELRRTQARPEPVPGDPGTPAVPPDEDTVVVAATRARVRASRAIAGICAVLSAALAALTLLPDGPWRAPLVSSAFIAGFAAVAALVDSVRFRSRLPATWTELQVIGPAAAEPWRLARTPDGTELAFKLTSTDDVLTRHIERTGHLRVLGEPRIGGPVRIAVPGHSPLGLAFFSLP